MKTRLLALVGILALATGALPAFGQSSGNAGAVDAAQSFYQWYLDYAQRSNPLVDGAYRASPWLAPALIESVDALVAAPDTLGADPFLCAQDVPERFELEPAATGGSVVLLREYFGGSPRPHQIALTLQPAGDGWQIAAIECAERLTPRGVVEDFYRRYLALFRPDAAGQSRNPLVEGLYRDDPALSAGLIARVDAELAAVQAGGGDPFLCAQDVPDSVWVDELSASATDAALLVYTTYPGNPTRSDLLVNLAREAGAWRIASIECEVPPELTAWNFYNWYRDFARLSMDYLPGARPLVDWGHRWDDYLSGDLLARLTAAFEASGALPADPVLCAQDVPERINVQALERSDSRATARVSGEYPSSPGQFVTYPLAIVDLSLVDGAWKLTSIVCGQ